MSKKKMALVCSAWLVLIAPKLFATNTNEKPAKEAAQAQPATASEDSDKETQQKSQQEKSEGSAVAKRPRANKSQATRDLVLTIAGLVAFVGLMAFLLRRPKDLDKYDKMYAELEKENESKTT